MTELRIYYECLEQAYHYIRPIVEKIAGKDINVSLVKRARYSDHLPKGSIYAIQSLTTPDILITGISERKEHPLVLIEFTEAVSTEDHELQRTYGAVATYLSGSYYIKVSGEKESDREHGGAEYNPYSTPKIFLEKLGYEGYIIADWATEEGNESLLRRSPDLPGCPPRIQVLDDTIYSAVAAFSKNPTNWYDASLASLKLNPAFKHYRLRVDSATGSSELLKVWKKREANNSNRDKLRFFVKQGSIAAKINRFSHAMDPDRGILTFLSFVFSATYKIYGIYALVRERTLRGSIDSLATLKRRFSAALQKDKGDGGSIPNWLVTELKSTIQKAASLDQSINIQHVWEKHFERIFENKVVLTLALFLDGLFLNQNGIKLIWDRRKLLGNSNGDFLDLLKSFLGFNNYSPPAQISQVGSDVDEDEVTYAITHRVLIPNKFKIISISYPGSQGSGAILPDRHEGRAQPREYPDIIAIPPERSANIDVLLNESKGMFNQNQVEGAVEKLQQYKSGAKYLKAVTELLVAVKVIDQNETVRNILIGVAFGVNRESSTTWNPSDIDFIFRIVERDKWSIGIFNQSLRDLIPTISGKTSFPSVYRIVPETSINRNQRNLFDQ